MEVAGCVSVIIPNYNNGIYLQKCIESCLEQKGLIREIVVVDDHSEDNSQAILESYREKYPKIIFWFINPGKGANDARNYGFVKSSGKYIQWLDSDDFILPGKFEVQVAAIESTDADIVYSDWIINFYNDGQRIREEFKQRYSYDDYLLELIRDNWTSPNNYLMNRRTAELLSQEEGWNPSTKVGQDREYFTMAGILGAKFQYVPGTFAVYNKHATGTISGIHFMRRLEENQFLEERLRVEILKSCHIPEKRKDQYLSILNTHKLKACIYHPKIKLSRPINPFKIAWREMHWKMRLMMPLIYLRKHLEFYL